MFIKKLFRFKILPNEIPTNDIKSFLLQIILLLTDNKYDSTNVWSFTLLALYSFKGLFSFIFIRVRLRY